MTTDLHIALLWLALIALAMMNVAQMVLIAVVAGDTTKFGRLLRKVRRAMKAKAANDPRERGAA